MSFTINKGIAIPPRTIPNAGPRQSKYPLDDMEQGDSFDIVVESEKQARQKQSQFSSLAKTRRIKLVTRYLAAEGLLRVWHDGDAPEQAEATEAEQAEAAELDL
ncbi:MAG: hypothetical protein V4649_19400 [Bacteroidota bacterium]